MYGVELAGADVVKRALQLNERLSLTAMGRGPRTKERLMAQNARNSDTQVRLAGAEQGGSGPDAG